MGAMRAIAIGFAALLCSVAALAEPSSPSDRPRAASVSVCTDQYLLSLADADQVAAVSWQATTARSPVRDAAIGLQQIRGLAEEILAVRADLVIFDPYGHPETARRLDGLGTDVFRLGDPVSVGDVEGEVTRMADALGQSARGAALVRTLEARRMALADTANENGPRALYVSPGGGGAGADTYVDEVLRLAGFRNLQADLGHVGWSRVPLEELVETPPDVIVMSFFETTDPSLLDSFSRHPLFRRMVDRTPIISVPAASWVCAGPFMLDAAEQLASERQRLFPHAAPELAEAAAR